MKLFRLKSVVPFTNCYLISTYLGSNAVATSEKVISIALLIKKSLEKQCL